MSDTNPDNHATATEVMSRLITRAIGLSRERNLSADALNQGGWKACLDEAFTLIDHAPYVSREALSAAHSAAVDAAGVAMWERIARLREAEDRARIT